VKRREFIIEHWKPVYKNSSTDEKVRMANAEIEYMKLANPDKGLVHSALVLEVYPKLGNPNVGGA
jgi:hypothetical protein